MSNGSELPLELEASHEGPLRDGNLPEHARDGGQVDVAVASPRHEPGRRTQTHRAIVGRLGLPER